MPRSPRRRVWAQPDGRRVRIPAPEPRATPPPAPAPPLGPPLPPARAAASSEDALVKGLGFPSYAAAVPARYMIPQVPYNDAVNYGPNGYAGDGGGRYQNKKPAAAIAAAPPPTLPNDLIKEILLRLPLDDLASLLCASLVCRTWSDIVKEQLKRAQQQEQLKRAQQLKCAQLELQLERALLERAQLQEQLERAQLLEQLEDAQLQEQIERVMQLAGTQLQEQLESGQLQEQVLFENAWLQLEKELDQLPRTSASSSSRAPSCRRRSASI